MAPSYHYRYFPQLPPNRLDTVEKNKDGSPVIEAIKPFMTDKEKLKQDLEALREGKASKITLKDFTELTKFKLSALNTTVAAAAYFLTTKCVFSDFYSIALFMLGT